jgi:hypothetical protein
LEGTTEKVLSWFVDMQREISYSASFIFGEKA